MTALHLRDMAATAASDDQDRRDGLVLVYGFAEWLKRGPMVSARIDPAAARRLATQLLVAAEIAEGTR